MKRFDYKMKILKTYTDFLEENDNQNKFAYITNNCNIGDFYDKKLF